MSKTNLFFSSLSALILGSAIPLGAATVIVTPGLLTSPQASASGMTTVDFDNGSAPSSFTFTGQSGVLTGSREFVYLQPANDSTPYGYVGPNGSITETLGAAGVGVDYFGLYWGSGDQYNSLTFTDTQGNTIVYGGGGIPIPEFTKWQGNTDSYVEFWDTGNNWVSVSYASTTAAFEFDNVTSGMLTLAPEPASFALLAIGCVAFGAGALRRRKRP
jgi:hypothetical protein